MFSRKKIAAVSALLGGLALTCTGVVQAFAAGTSSSCSPGALGSMTCVQRIVSDGSEGDEVVYRKSQNCQPVKPLELPVIPLLNNGTTRLGPEVTCSGAGPELENTDEMAPVQS